MRTVIVSINRKMNIDETDFQYFQELIEDGRLDLFEFETDLTLAGTPSMKEVVQEKEVKKRKKPQKSKKKSKKSKKRV